MKSIYKNVAVLDSGARGSTMTFTKRDIGDVLITWENEAYLALQEYGADKFEIIVPSISIRAEPAVSLVDGNVDAKGTRKVAQEYLEFLYTPQAQNIIAKNYYRPARTDLVTKENLKQFPKLELVTIDETFGGWNQAQKKHFSDGGIFDEIQK